MYKSRTVRSWTRQETLDLLDILRTSCLGYLDGTHSNRKGEMYRCIEEELRNRDPTTTRDARQIENKWKSLKLAYDTHKQDQETGQASSKPCEYVEEMDELFLFIANRSLMMNTTVETITTTDDVAYFEDGLLVEESQDYSMDEDAVVIEEIVYDSQDALDFDETAATSSSTKPMPRGKKLTTENMDALLLKLSDMQKDQDGSFIRKQMEIIENEFEAFREKEKEHWSQLKLDLEDLKEKYLLRIRRIAHGDGPLEDGVDETGVCVAKRRRTTGGTSGRRK
uniref:Myb/SANT-like DNA-binding domain-containing protein n=1 Tax=Anopheles atroparvus TaxID=41427 RepID=A0A182JIQ0_ANOAO